MWCIICGGVLALLGKLGNKAWFRCTACGLEQCRPASEVEADETQEG
jgi:hypothetical protein